MKKILLLFFTLAVIFTFSGCSNTDANNERTASEVSKNNSTDEPRPSILHTAWAI